MSQHTVNGTLLCDGGFVSQHWEVSILLFYLCLIPSIISPSQYPAQGHRVQRLLHFFFITQGAFYPETTLVCVRPSLVFLVSTIGTTAQRALYVFLFPFKQTQQNLYINKQITNFMFPVDGQVGSGPLLLNCQHSAIHSANWAASTRQKHAIRKTKTKQTNQKKGKKKKESHSSCKPTVTLYPMSPQVGRKTRKGGKIKTYMCACVRGAAGVELKTAI